MLDITFKDIQDANDTIRTTDIKGKEYAEVNQRIKAFRMVYPMGYIITNMISNQNGVCIFKAEVGYEFTMLNTNTNEVSATKKVLGTGTAYEKEDSTFINKTSYIENCETSAVGRALGMCGFGIDTSVASAEEVQNAINNQSTITTEEEARSLELTFGQHKGETIGDLVDNEEESYLRYLWQHGNPDVKQAVTILTGWKELSIEESKEEILNMPILETQKQQIRELDKEVVKAYLIKKGKRNIRELTFEEADQLIKGELD